MNHTEHISLAGAAWTVRPIGDLAAVPAALRDRSFPAVVPGCVHTDLIAAGAIGHPNEGFNELAQSWIGETDWEYRAEFAVTPDLLAHARVDLVCDGLDTIADVLVNGVLVGCAANMHHPHRFDVRGELRPGRNELVIQFRAPLAHIRAEEARLGPRPVNGDWDPYVFIRKTACNFGWDWGPKVPTVGIWRPIGLHAWNDVRLATVRPLVWHETADAWRVDVHAGLEWADAGCTDRPVRLVAEIRDPTGLRVRRDVDVPAHQSDALISLPVIGPELWWPRGHGAARRYPLDVWLEYADVPDGPGDAERLDRWSGRIGFRTVRLDTAPDEAGSAFTFEINGRPIFCRGANWISEGLFPADRTPARCRQRLQQAADANMNMVRVWGGGLYEDDAFYDVCDELGLLVWQDFLFACATYPEDDPYPALIEAEVRHNVARLSPHPSLVLWCGGNECVWAYESWGFRQRLRPGQTWGAGYYFDLLPRLVAELEPTRPYWPNSPYSGTPDRPVLDPDHGNRHTWDAQVAGYRALVPRFVSEFGHQSPPNWATLRAALPAEELRLGSRALDHRQRAGGGNAVRYDQPLAEWFRPPADFDEWHYLAQLLQTRAISLAIEWLRSNQPCCMGALFWQLNDAWAGHSWSAIDSAGRRKPLWYAVRRACAPRLLTLQPVAERPALFLVNETAVDWTARVRVRRMSFAGETRAESAVELRVPPFSSRHADALAASITTPHDPLGELIVAEADGLRAFWFFAADKELHYPPPHFDAHFERTGDGLAVHIAAHTLLRDIILAVDRLDPDASADEQVVTLLPGERCVFHVRTAADLSPAALASAPVFRCANDFGGRPA